MPIPDFDAAYNPSTPLGDIWVLGQPGDATADFTDAHQMLSILSQPALGSQRRGVYIRQGNYELPPGRHYNVWLKGNEATPGLWLQEPGAIINGKLADGQPYEPTDYLGNAGDAAPHKWLTFQNPHMCIYGLVAENMGGITLVEHSYNIRGTRFRQVYRDAITTFEPKFKGDTRLADTLIWMIHNRIHKTGDRWYVAGQHGYYFMSVLDVEGIEVLNLLVVGATGGTIHAKHYQEETAFYGVKLENVYGIANRSHLLMDARFVDAGLVASLSVGGGFLRPEDMEELPKILRGIEPRPDDRNKQGQPFDAASGPGSAGQVLLARGGNDLTMEGAQLDVYDDDCTGLMHRGTTKLNLLNNTWRLNKATRANFNNPNSSQGVTAPDKMEEHGDYSQLRDDSVTFWNHAATAMVQGAAHLDRWPTVQTLARQFKQPPVLGENWFGSIAWPSETLPPIDPPAEDTADVEMHTGEDEMAPSEGFHLLDMLWSPPYPPGEVYASNQGPPHGFRLVLGNEPAPTETTVTLVDPQNGETVAVFNAPLVPGVNVPPGIGAQGKMFLNSLFTGEATQVRVEVVGTEVVKADVQAYGNVSFIPGDEPEDVTNEEIMERLDELAEALDKTSKVAFRTAEKLGVLCGALEASSGVLNQLLGTAPDPTEPE